MTAKWGLSTTMNSDSATPASAKMSGRLQVPELNAKMELLSQTATSPHGEIVTLNVGGKRWAYKWEGTTVT